jgi:hypothetical protein
MFIVETKSHHKEHDVLLSCVLSIILIIKNLKIKCHNLIRCRSHWPRGLRPAAIVGSNPTGGMEVCLLCVLCVVSYRSLLPADHSFRGVLPTVTRRFV